MSYVVLARKWRPMTFADLVGQEHVAKTLENAIALGRVAHAFLFTGVRGVGKTTSARILAKALNCEKGPTATPCLTCAACTEISAGLDMDVQEIDAASRTGVDDIRDLQETLVYRPSRDRFKIFIVDEVHMLSSSAWNAFLKTLEEPPPHVKFIFATTEVTKVPVTILSRCQRYDFKLIGTQAVAARLNHVLGAEGIAADPDAVHLLSREAAGSMRDAMSLLDQVIAWTGPNQRLTAVGAGEALGVAESQTLLAIARGVVTGQAEPCLNLVGGLSERGYDLGHVTRDLLSVFRDLVVLRVAPDSRDLIDLPESDRAELEGIANQAPSVDDLSRLYLGFSKSSEEILKSPLPRASLEMALVRLSRRPPLLPIDELLKRLGELEHRLAHGQADAPSRARSQDRPQGRPQGREHGSRGEPEPGEPHEEPAPRPDRRSTESTSESSPAPLGAEPRPTDKAPTASTATRTAKIATEADPDPLSARIEAAIPDDADPSPPSTRIDAATPNDDDPWDDAPSDHEEPILATALMERALDIELVSTQTEPPSALHVGNPVDREARFARPAHAPAPLPAPGLDRERGGGAPNPFSSFIPKDLGRRPGRPASDTESTQPARFAGPEGPEGRTERVDRADPRPERQGRPSGADAPAAPPPHYRLQAPDEWRLFGCAIEEVRKRSARYGSMLERTTLVGISASERRIQVGVDPTSFEASFLGTDEAKRLLQEAAVAFFGGGATWELHSVSITRADPTFSRLVDHERERRRLAMQEKLQNHPMVVAAMAALSASIRELRPAKVNQAIALADLPLDAAG